MSRAADPFATTTGTLPGGCQCPGAPHEADTAVIRWSLGASALARIGRAELDGAVNLDPMAGYRQTVVETIESWNLLWLAPAEDGKERKPVPIPITPATVAELDVDTLKFLAETADGLIQNAGTLPNDSGAPSAESPRESASPTPTKTRKRTT